MSVVNLLEKLIQIINHTKSLIYGKPSSVLDQIDQVESTIDDPLKALNDIGSLFEAHTTKLGIIFKPPLSEDAALKCIEDFIGLFPLLSAVYLQTSELQDGVLVRSEIRIRLTELCSTSLALGFELLDNVKRNDSPPNVSSNGQLMTIGKVWECSRRLQSLHDLGPQGILSHKIDEFSGILNDAKEDLKSWVENDNDDFGWDFSDGEGEDLAHVNNNSNDDNESSLRNEDTIALANKWIDKITKLNILYLAIQKRRLSTMDKLTSTKLHAIMGNLSTALDDLVAGFLEGSSQEELESQVDIVNVMVKKLLDIVKQDEPQDKFASWSSMFTENFFKRE